MRGPSAGHCLRMPFSFDVLSPRWPRGRGAECGEGPRMPDYDSAWKELIDRFLELVLMLPYPDVWSEIDWAQGTPSTPFCARSCPRGRPATASPTSSCSPGRRAAT